ncbi:MAG: monovalent cation/H(+) antiporter subunit G [Chloroflexota bacterium]
MSLDSILDAVVAVLLALATIFALLGAVGLARMPDIYTRAQSAAKSATLGIILLFLAVGLHLGGLGAVTKCAAIILFAFLSIPIAAHVVTRAAHDAGVPIGGDESVDEL